MRTLLAFAMLALAGCGSSRTVEIVTKPAPAAASPSHFRIASIDERGDVVLEPVTIEIVDVEGDETEIIRVSGKDAVVLPFDRFALILEEGGHDAIEVETGDIVKAEYGPEGRLSTLTLR